MNAMGPGVSEEDRAVRLKIEALRQEHRDLDAAIAALAEAWPVDQLQMARLKKKKLMLKDQVAFLENQLIPDIIA
jgi:hypothetical protein